MPDRASPPRFKRGLVVGKFAPLHRGHQRLIEAARAQCERVVVMVWSNPDFPAMLTPVRVGWIRSLYPDVDVMGFEAGEAPANAAPAAVHHAFVRSNLPYPVEAVFSAEAYGPAFAAALGAEHIAVDYPRPPEGISGTRLRADVHAHRAWLDPIVYGHFVERVVFLGAESSGKSTLAAACAERLQTALVPEYGRTLWEAKGGRLAPPDFIHIAEMHRRHEEEAVREAWRYLFVDTNALTTQLYAFFYHGTCPERVQELAAECRDRYRHVFVCAPDFPFVQDGTRVHPQVQQYMDGAIRNDLTVRGIPYLVLYGPLPTRIEAVLSVLQTQ